MQDKSPRLVVGLGNPGDTYRLTRHNIGFRVIDRLAGAYKIALQQLRYGARFGFGYIESNPVILAQPQQYMNISGPPTKALVDHYSISSRDMIVIHDDMDLAFGRLKIKEKGGHGGHKGIISLMDAIGDGDFIRLRIGIGRSTAGSHGPDSVVEHVLGRFTTEENAFLDKIFEGAQAAVVASLCLGAKESMNRFNSKKNLISDQLLYGG